MTHRFSVRPSSPKAALKQLPTIAALFLIGCASESQRADPRDTAILAAIADENVEEVKQLRSLRDSSIEELKTKRFIIYQSRKSAYLVDFGTGCWNQRGWGVQSDVVRDRSYLRAGTDTLRGCLIRRAYALSPEQRAAIVAAGQ